MLEQLRDLLTAEPMRTQLGAKQVKLRGEALAKNAEGNYLTPVVTLELGASDPIRGWQQGQFVTATYYIRPEVERAVLHRGVTALCGALEGLTLHEEGVTVHFGGRPGQTGDFPDDGLGLIGRSCRALALRAD